jgi:hypothetical protein
MSEKINSEQFFNDIGFDDYLPTFKAKIYTKTVEAEVVEIHAAWTQEINRDILNRIMNLGINENRQG